MCRPVSLTLSEVQLAETPKLRGGDYYTSRQGRVGPLAKFRIELARDLAGNRHPIKRTTGAPRAYRLHQDKFSEALMRSGNDCISTQQFFVPGIGPDH